MEIYKSPYEAYPFLSESPENLRCDFELLTDEIASQIGLLSSKVKDKKLKKELLWIDELVYHLNPTLRTSFTITKEEINKLRKLVDHLKEKYKNQDFQFVLPQGNDKACLAHILRVQFKKLVRLIYHFINQGNKVNSDCIDFINLLSAYFFYLALKFNNDAEIPEIEFKSRNY